MSNLRFREIIEFFELKIGRRYCFYKNNDISYLLSIILEKFRIGKIY